MVALQPFAPNHSLANSILIAVDSWRGFSLVVGSGVCTTALNTKVRSILGHEPLKHVSSVRH